MMHPPQLTNQQLIEQFLSSFPFALDSFQKESIGHILDGTNLVVSAPTGTGKTIIAEAAAVLALHQGVKLFYTTPIKALSNQKYRDFSDKWGVENVGLLTGDQSVNGEAPIVVMTTEVLRNMIYANSPTLRQLRYVVMDEVHYISDAFRGAVWEEVILSLPEGVQLIALSATIGNSTQFAEWIETLLGPTAVVRTDFRPVPLSLHLLAGGSIYPFASSEEGDINPLLIDRVDTLRTMGHSEERFPNRVRIVDTLADYNMLPAIDFIFSRAGCDGALAQCGRSTLTLTTKQERAKIYHHIDQRCARLNESDREALGFKRWRVLLGRGFAAHHAGMLPLFKQVVEELFTEGLLKVVFATSTLSLGINMPARAVVLERLVKFNGSTHETLTSSQFAQLIGRAGRRGIDDAGHAVVYFGSHVDIDEVWDLYRAAPAPLQSSFHIGYNMAVNLLASHSYTSAENLLLQSFGQFQNNAEVVGVQRALSTIHRRIEEVDKDLPPSLVSYLDLVLHITRETRAWEKECRSVRRVASSQGTTHLRRGDVVCTKVQRKPVLAVVLERPRRNRVLVATSNWVGTTHCPNLCDGGKPLGSVKLPTGKATDDNASISRARSLLDKGRFKVPKSARREVDLQVPVELKRLRRELRQHPLHGTLSSHEIATLNDKRTRLVQQQDILANKLSHFSSSFATDFASLTAILRGTGYLTDSNQLTESGEMLRLVYCEADFVCCEALREGAWEGLTSSELASVISLLTGEGRKESHFSLPQDCSPRLSEAIAHTQRIVHDIAQLEQRHNLLFTPQLYGGYMEAVQLWAEGGSLEECVQVASMRGVSLTPGDFVRHVRQIIDLLSQLSVLRVETVGPLAEEARRARNLLQRGIVSEEL